MASIQFCCIAASGSGFPGAVVGVVVVALLVVTALTTVIILLALRLRRYVNIDYEVSYVIYMPEGHRAKEM